MQGHNSYPRIVRLSDAVVSRELRELLGRSHVCATVGNFDGLHLGHCALFSELLRTGKHYTNPYRVVVTFRPYPRNVLCVKDGDANNRGDIRKTNEILTCIRTKLSILSRYSVDAVFVIRFTKTFAKISAEDFLQKYFIDLLGVKHLVVGYDWGFGQARSGGTELLKNFCDKQKVDLTIVPPIEIDGRRVSSTAVREFLRVGDVHIVRALLGRFHRVIGRVQHGSKRGTTLGFPTANLFAVDGFMPRHGVYASRVYTNDGRVYNAVVNVGIRPTFETFSDNVRNNASTNGAIMLNTSETTLEAHLLTNEPLSLYGTRIEVEFIKRLRDEIRFENAKALSDAILQDIRVAEELLK